MQWEELPGRTRIDACDLCEEARITEWFHEDEDCWIAECEVCSVPMVVWRNHDHRPSDEVKAALHERLAAIVDLHFDFRDGFYVDDNMRNIPDHYHAHARPRGGFFGHGLRRRTPLADAGREPAGTRPSRRTTTASACIGRFDVVARSDLVRVGDGSGGRERRVSVGGMLAVGDPAPAFSLPDQNGETVDSSSLKGRRALVYFYPRADTPGCTTQACGLRDVLGQVGDTAIIGISPDKPAALEKFDKKYGLGFTLLSDTDHATAEAFGVWQEKKMYGKASMGIVRSAFLVGADGRLEQVWYKVSPKDTPTNLLEALPSG